MINKSIVLALVAAGRRSDARAWAGFVPDCLVLFKRLIGDARHGLVGLLLQERDEAVLLAGEMLVEGTP